MSDKEAEPKKHSAELPSDSLPNDERLERKGASLSCAAPHHPLFWPEEYNLLPAVLTRAPASAPLPQSSADPPLFGAGSATTALGAGRMAAMAFAVASSALDASKAACKFA